jgi:hypothetical protein
MGEIDVVMLVMHDASKHRLAECLQSIACLRKGSIGAAVPC